MEIKLTIPEAKKTRVIDAYCKFLDYDKSKLEDETKSQFIKRQLIEQVKNIVREQEETDMRAENKFEDIEIS